MLHPIGENFKLLTYGEKFNIITRWIEHTDEKCFDNKDAND